MTSITPAPVLTSEQLDFFGDHTRLPRRPYSTDDLAAGLRIRSLKAALTRRYIQVNPPHLRVWALFDIDRQGAAVAWEDADLPPPSWAAANRLNGHAHLSWGLSAPVLVDGLHARRAPMRYLAAIESAFRAKLEADPGFGGLITKNPANPFWKILKGPRDHYDLGYLAEHVDLSAHLPRRGTHVEQVGLGRNCELFDWVRRAAYRRVVRARGEGNYVFWQKEVYDLAMVRNGEFSVPLDSREVYHLARSVSKWTWNRYTGSRGPGGGDVAPEVLSQVQSALGRLSGAARRAATEDKRASARLMAAQGHSIRAIADALEVPKTTVGRWVSHEPIR